MRVFSFIVSVIQIALFVLLAVVLTYKVARAHEWYPPECCSDSDCREVPPPEEKNGGFVFSEGFVPYNKVQQSPDGKWHICVPYEKIKCTFGPIGGV